MAIQQGATNSWVKSSYSTGNGACVEVRSPIAHTVDIRDSKVIEGPTIAFTPQSWTSFLNDVHRGSAELG
ncbi:DUF397 domain-containing protein [Streptomyces uncialis]|uniref:DUF397 domain-containing protein n=1 Tax=Streptomyces uncialis TaxID=1048205 RepID=UPI0037F3A541